MFSNAKRAVHPSAGLLNLTYTNLWLDQPGTRVGAFTPAHEQTAERLETLYRSL